MKGRHEPLRMCVCCRQSRKKEELVRVVKKQTGEIAPDETGKAAGRGVYVCRNVDCMEKVCKKKLLNRALKCNVPQDVYDTLREMVSRGSE